MTLKQINWGNLKFCILMASHIRSTRQLHLLQNTSIPSLLNQSKPASIFISISFDNVHLKQLFHSTVHRHYFEFKSINWRISSKQKYQIEHYDRLLPDVTKYDLILFCDDDDEYHPKRVERFQQGYQIFHMQSSKHSTFAGVKETSICFDPSEIEPIQKGQFEYYHYGITPKVMNMFCQRFSKHMNVSKFVYSDLFFREFMSRLGNVKWFTIPFDPHQILYIHHSNSGGVTQQYRKKYSRDWKSVTRANMLMMLITRKKRHFNAALLSMILCFPVEREQTFLTTFLVEIKRFEAICTELYDDCETAG
eukprot:130594_1